MYRRILSCLLLIVLCVSLLSGCGAESSPVSAPAAQTASPESGADEQPESAQAQTKAPDASVASLPLATPSLSMSGLTDAQRNSISMLNHLVVLSQEIGTNRSNRLYLEEAYSSLFNNTHPNAVDLRTQNEINDLADSMEEFRMISVQRERLQYIYEQNCAQAARDAIPDPVSLLSLVSSGSLVKLAASIVYMAVDSYASYESGMADADMEFLSDNWELDDAEAARIHSLTVGTFNFMVDTVRDYDLPGELALTEEAVEAYAYWKNETNTLQQIQFFESKMDVYQAFGPYWLTLADCYYQNGDHAKCLQALETYLALDIRIFRHDYDLAQTLPLAITSARQIMTDAEYIPVAEAYAAMLLENTGDNQWALRYFAAQTYIELYALTQDEGYLTQAYDIALNNTNVLLQKQKDLNREYMAQVHQEEIPKDATSEQKSQIKAYNKMMKEERKPALPPLYEPLLLNCDLLFALADRIGISDAEKQRLDGILHENGEPLFLVRPIDDLYYLSAAVKPIDPQSIDVSFDGESLSLPAVYVTDTADIQVCVTSPEGTVEWTDWTIREVTREDADDANTFIAVYTCADAEAYDYVPDSTVTIRILPRDGSAAEALHFEFVTVAAKKFLVINDVEFQRVK